MPAQYHHATTSTGISIDLVVSIVIDFFTRVLFLQKKRRAKFVVPQSRPPPNHLVLYLTRPRICATSPSSPVPSLRRCRRRPVRQQLPARSTDVRERARARPARLRAAPLVPVRLGALPRATAGGRRPARARAGLAAAGVSRRQAWRRDWGAQRPCRVLPPACGLGDSRPESTGVHGALECRGDGGEGEEEEAAAAGEDAGEGGDEDGLHGLTNCPS